MNGCMCHLCLIQKEVLRAVGFVVLNLFTSDCKVNKRGETLIDDIHLLVLWHPLEAFDCIALSIFFF